MTFSEKRDTRLTYTQHLISAGIAATSAKTMVAPLDVLKIRYQVGTPETMNGLSHAISRIKNTEGLRAFWKGNFIGCMRIIPGSLAQLMVFQRIRLNVADEYGRVSTFTAFVAASGSGLFATAFLYPTDLIKTRLIVQTNHDNHQSLRNLVKQVYKENGIRGYYKGMLTTILGTIPYTTTMFFIYEFIGVNESTPLSLFIGGCTATAIAQTIAFPFDRAKRILQVQCNPFKDNKRITITSDTMTETFRTIVKKEKASGLFRGNIFSLLKIFPHTGIMYIIYEIMKANFLFHNGYHAQPFEKHIDQSFNPEELEDFLEEIEASEELEVVELRKDSSFENQQKQI